MRNDWMFPLLPSLLVRGDAAVFSPYYIRGWSVSQSDLSPRKTPGFGVDNRIAEVGKKRQYVSSFPFPLVFSYLLPSYLELCTRDTDAAAAA